MAFTKTHFDNLIKKDGHLILVAHTDMNVHCDCYNFDTHEGVPDCHKCFGTGWKYEWYTTKARRSLKGQIEGIDLNLPVKIDGQRYLYYLKSEANIGEKDFILEFIKPEGRNKYNLYFVSSSINNEGEKSEISFKTAFTNKVLLNMNQLLKALELINISKLTEV